MLSAHLHHGTEEFRVRDDIRRVLRGSPRDGLQSPDPVLALGGGEFAIPLQPVDQVGEARERRVGEGVS